MLNTEDIRFQKVRHVEKDEKTELAFQNPVKGGFNDFTFNTALPPHPDFLKALQALAPAVIEVAELKGVAEPDDIEVRQVSIRYHTNETVGVVITAIRTLKSKASMTINTPHKLLDGLDESPEEQLLSDDAAEAIRTLQTEAVLFLRGKRAQLEMELDGVEEPTEGQAETEFEEQEEGELVGAGADVTDGLL